MQVRSVCHLPLSLAVEGLEPQFVLKSVDKSFIVSATSVRCRDTRCTSKMLEQDIVTESWYLTGSGLSKRWYQQA